MNINYYNILGIDEHADDEEIRRAYKRLAVIWHPDKHQGVAKSDAEIKFKEISEAYSILSDRDKRTEYDNVRRGGLSRIMFGGFDYDPFDIFSRVFGRRDPFFDNFNFRDPFQFENKFNTPEKPIRTSIKKTTQIM